MQLADNMIELASPSVEIRSIASRNRAVGPELTAGSGALEAYDAMLCPEISPLILRNRGAGPFGLLNLLDDRCGGVFENIDDVISRSERDEFMQRYKMAAGFAAERLNAAPSIIPAGARVSERRLLEPAC